MCAELESKDPQDNANPQPQTYTESFGPQATNARSARPGQAQARPSPDQDSPDRRTVLNTACSLACFCCLCSLQSGCHRFGYNLSTVYQQWLSHSLFVSHSLSLPHSLSPSSCPFSMPLCRWSSLARPFVLVRSCAIFQQFLLFNWHLFVHVWEYPCASVCLCKYSCVFIAEHFTTGGGRHFCNYSRKLIWFLILISIDSIFNEARGQLD